MGVSAAVGCAWRDMLWWEVGVAGSARGKQLGAMGGARRLRAF